ncbi:MAG: methyltransferase domain-containing protein [Pseudomonadota bacterium]
MDRLEQILKFATRPQKGVEIGPYFNPLVPKSAGWDVLVLDVFETERLRAMASADPSVADDRIAAIEPVDLVGPAHRLAELAAERGIAPGTLDFVVSSHNFEHLPDPVRFLQAVARVLRPGGVLSMAIPDCRYSFDALRPPSTAGAMIEAFLEARERPSPRQEFEHFTMLAECRREDGVVQNHFFDAGANAMPSFVTPVSPQLARWRGRLGGAVEEYRDVHCWLLTPAVFQAIIAELRALDLCALEVEEVTANNGIEFYVHLRRPVQAAPPAEGERCAAYAGQLREFRNGSAPPPVPVAPLSRKAMVKGLIRDTPWLGPAARAVWRLARRR